MKITTRAQDPDEQTLVAMAARGDEEAYIRLVEGHRSELHAHCYRILASVDEADEALQEALVRAWRGLGRFEGRSSVRTWLFTIATNSALDAARRRSRRELPVDLGPATRRGEDPGAPLGETRWIGPYPEVGIAEGKASPEARYERRESLELAFVAALQHLPATQRAVLILREVLGYHADEVATMLDTTVAAVNSSLQRARATAAARIPPRSQQAALADVGDAGIRRLAERYSDAIEAGDVDTLISMLTEDASWAMPPVGSWYRGHEAIAEFQRRSVLPERWKHRPTRANGQLAVGGYLYDADRDCFTAAALDVITLEGSKIAAVTGFLTSVGSGDSTTASPDFPRFGLPAELPA